MLEHFCEKKINGRNIIYDHRRDIIKFAKNEDIADHYSKERLARVAPFKTDIVITKQCNQKCINCFTNSVPSESSLELSYSDILHNIRERHKNIIRLVITGGEPFLHSDIQKILELPPMFQDLKFVICTNGTSIRDSHVDLIKDFDWLTILSIHGDMETHNTYTRSNSYQHVIRSLEKLSNVARVKIYSVINEYSTQKDIDHIFSLKKVYDIGAIKFMTPRNSDRFDGKYNQCMVEYVKSKLDKESGLQETSAETELITVRNEVTTTA